MRLILLTCLSFLLSLSAIPAFALPGEAAAVIRTCGLPQSENIATSEVTNRLQRDLTYGETTLHFIPDGAGWSFTTAWSGHLPISRSRLESIMPCFDEAMAQAATQPFSPTDPAIARQQTATSASVSANTWGIPHFWPILTLVMLLVIFALWPRRNPAVPSKLPPARRYRRPGLPSSLLRRLPRKVPIR
jgi:hypothetical protein